MEVWKIIPGFDDRYEASNQGRIRSRETGVVYKQKLAGPLRKGGGYLSVNLRNKGVRKVKSKYVHTCVLEAFRSTRGENQECRHLDGNKFNNKLDNLEWGSKVQNQHDKRMHGTQASGQDVKTSVLTEDRVREIHAAVVGEENATLVEIANRYSVSIATVAKIARGKAWKHLRLEGFKRRRFDNRKKLDEQDVLKIYECAKSGMLYEDIGNEFGVGGPTVSLIARGRIWKHLNLEPLAARRKSK